MEGKSKTEKAKGKAAMTKAELLEEARQRVSMERKVRLAAELERGEGIGEDVGGSHVRSQEEIGEGETGGDGTKGEDWNVPGHPEVEGNGDMAGDEQLNNGNIWAKETMGERRTY